MKKDISLYLREKNCEISDCTFELSQLRIGNLTESQAILFDELANARQFATIYNSIYR